MIDLQIDEKYMRLALDEAKKAEGEDEVPVGAVIVRNGEVIASAYNTREYGKNALYHAEIKAIDEACKKLGGWRLVGCTMYVTLEPCPMCAGALINSRIERVVFGCRDAVAGACGSVVKLNSYPFNHSFKLEEGVLADESKELLPRFFEERRKK